MNCLLRRRSNLQLIAWLCQLHIDCCYHLTDGWHFLRPRCCWKDPAPRQALPPNFAHTWVRDNGWEDYQILDKTRLALICDKLHTKYGCLTQISSYLKESPAPLYTSPWLPAGFYLQQSWASAEGFCPTTNFMPGRIGKTAPLSTGKHGQKTSGVEDVALPKTISSWAP